MLKKRREIVVAAARRQKKNDMIGWEDAIDAKLSAWGIARLIVA